MLKKKLYRVRVTQRVVEEGWAQVEARSRSEAIALAPKVCQNQDVSWRFAYAEDDPVEAWTAEEIKRA